MTSSGELPNYSESARSEKYVASAQLPNDPNSYMRSEGCVPSALPTYMPQGGQVQYVPQTPMNQGPIFMPVLNPIDPTINQIRDWLPWSIVNIFVGWCLLGFIPLIFSLICRSRKRSNDASGARTMSTLALVFNILVTLGGLAAWIGLIVALVIASKATSKYSAACIYGYC